MPLSGSRSSPSATTSRTSGLIANYRRVRGLTYAPAYNSAQTLSTAISPFMPTAASAALFSSSDESFTARTARRAIPTCPFILHSIQHGLRPCDGVEILPIVGLTIHVVFILAADEFGCEAQRRCPPTIKRFRNTGRHVLQSRMQRYPPAFRQYSSIRCM